MKFRLLIPLCVILFASLSSCGGGNLVGELDVNTIVSDGIVSEGETLFVQNGAEITVQGELVVDGTIQADRGPIRIVVESNGRLIINGTLRAMVSEEDLGDDPIYGGIYIVAYGELIFNPTARVETNGHVIITDDPAELNRDPEDIAAETDSASGDLNTFVPLPPDDPAFREQDSLLPHIRASKLLPARQDLPTVIISGDWDVGNFPGDQQIILVRFNFPANVALRDIEISGPPAPDGEDEEIDQDIDGSGDAKGGDGKNGLRLNIRSSQGSVEVENAIFNLTDGGNGGLALAVCGTAEGGQGGESGNMRITAATGITVRDTIINPGRSGDGGFALTTCKEPGGNASEAIGGAGANNTKRLYARGNVEIDNLTIGPLIAGNGGYAEALGGNGKDGDGCEDGGDGGNAYAEGGAGGDASLNVSGLPVVVSEVFGGDGGDALAQAGNGGNGGLCLCLTTAGGLGGTATAIPGKGGHASGGNPSVDGSDGEVEEIDGLEGIGLKDICAEALDAYQQGDLDLALDLFDLAIEEYPNEARVFYHRAVVLYELGLLEEAVDGFRRVLELDPDSEMAYYSLGISLYDLGLYTEAREAFREAVHLNPDYDFAWYGRALAEEALGLTEEALDSYLSFLELHPDDDEFRAYANQRVAVLRGGAGESGTGGVSVSGSYAHTQPGIQSEVYIDIQGPAGAAVQFTLSGPGVLGSSTRSGTIGDNGSLRLTWAINQTGSYTATGTVNGQSFTIIINVQ